MPTGISIKGLLSKRLHLLAEDQSASLSTSLRESTFYRAVDVTAIRTLCALKVNVSIDARLRNVLTHLAIVEECTALCGLKYEIDIELSDLRDRV